MNFSSSTRLVVFQSPDANFILATARRGFRHLVLTSMGGISGAFLLLPLQMSVLSFTSPAVSATNLVSNLVATPGGIHRYAREEPVIWPLALLVVAGSIPGVVAGGLIRLSYLPDARRRAAGPPSKAGAVLKRDQSRRNQVGSKRVEAINAGIALIGQRDRSQGAGSLHGWPRIKLGGRNAAPRVGAVRAGYHQTTAERRS